MLKFTVKLAVNIIVLPLIWLFLIVLSLLLYLLAHLPRAFSGRYYHWLSRFWCRVFIRALGVDLRLVHKNKLPLPEQYILIANHPSIVEDFAIPAFFDVYPLAKEGVRKWFVLGRISDYAGTIYVKRDSAESRHAALQALDDAVKAGKNIVIFPEGGCKGRRIHTHFQTGAFDIALQSGIPVVPVYLQYIDQDTFEWTDQSMLQILWQILRSKNKRVNYYVFDAISPDGFSDKAQYAEQVHKKYLLWQKEYLNAL